jgi:hypothetical protein
MTAHRLFAGGALCLLPLVAQATSAAPGWVLWLEQVRMMSGDPQPTTTWTIQTAVPTIEACRAAGAIETHSLVKRYQLSQVHASLGIQATEEIPNGVFVTYMDRRKRSTGWHRSVYYCLPDTVDPRGPKGK